jgi:hypothetical protein
MPTLTGEQIGVLIYANKKWGPGGDAKTVVKFLDTAIAIALAESGGNTDAVSQTGDYGLYQINRAAHADLFANHTWNDPASNTDMARIVWENAGKSFSPWTTYKTGAYKSHLGYGQKVYDKLEPMVHSKNTSGIQALLNTIPLVGPAAGAAAAGLGAAGVNIPTPTGIAGIVSGALSDLMTWLSTAFLSIGAALLAALLIVLGFWFLVSNTKVGEKVKSGVGNAAKVAAVV